MSTTLEERTTTPTTVDILRDARAKVDDAWCQGAYSKMVPDTATGGFKEAVCSEGALHRALRDIRYDNTLFSKAYESLNTAAKEAGGESVVHYNDTPSRTKAEVLAVFDRAIEIASAQ